ncbi:MAG: hypothetical protein Q8K75_01615 [Chlamydiales bacterium]|nr:hypothetical protein [Chlamydiales bacterium]
MTAIEQVTSRRLLHKMTVCVALQLAIDTYIAVCKEASDMQRTITRSFGLPLAAFAFSKKNQDTLHHLFEQVESMVSYSIYSCTQPTQGVLHQFRNDCRKLHQLSLSDSTATLYKIADKAWIEAQHAIHAYTHGSDDAEKRLPFLGYIVKMVKTVERFRKSWPKMLVDFRQDENVLFFLLRRRVDLDPLCGTGFVRDLLQKLWPKGRQELESFVLAAYRRRGFDQLVPQIRAACEELAPW